MTGVHRLGQRGDEETAAEVVDAVHGILIIQWTSQR